ncbi:unnamed protein product [Paramecium sonneborni]|uniref:Uncharacterized protein n=1 Tax=Paramecium sonneborni TaxID=65129 RepID=A0A8S1QFM1_9CILI|nr:unnamed protein product [Paramecium sonneborni]
MMKDQDVLEFHDYKQSILLKMLRVYQEVYGDCDGDRIIIEAYNTQITKQDFDNFVVDPNYELSTTIVILYLNYIIKYSQITQKIAPYFLIITSEDYNPSFGNVILYDGQLINQVPLAKFKYDGNKQNAPIVILMRCKNKWNMIILELQPWIIDFRCDKNTSFNAISTFASQFILDTFGIQIKNFNDFMLDYEQLGDQGDLIVFALYKVFIMNLDLTGDSLLSKSDYTTAKRKLLWLALSHMKERSKEDDDAEFTRRLIKKQKEDMQKQMEEEEERKREIKNKLSEKKMQVYGFLHTVEQPQEIRKVEETAEQILLKKQLAQFNVTRPRNKVEAFLTRMRVKEPFQFEYPEPPKYEAPKKDPKGLVKNFVYEVEWPKISPGIKQMITPASYCVSQIFSDTPLQLDQGRMERVYDYEILEQVEKQKQKEQQQQQQQQRQIVQKNGSYFGQIGSRVFDRSDYTNGVVIPAGRKIVKQIEKVDSKEKKLHKMEMMDRCIEQLEDELFLNY